MKRANAIIGRTQTVDGKRPVRSAAANQDQRRKQILKTLRDQDRAQKKQSLSLSARMQAAGLGENLRNFWIASGILGAAVFLVVLVLRQPLWVALILGAGGGLGLPRWIVGFLAKRRVGKFTHTFPDAMDIIVRGIKSGLPVHDCLRVISQETPEPLCSEFKRMIENVGMGMTMDQALDKMFERMPTPEVRFFGIVLAIQSKTGGNLAEALGNLSSVIRARKLMREKIKALSGEAVASAWIIGSMPPGVVLMISMLSPTYMVPMFTDHRGQVMLGAGAFWMALGIFTMRKMINFKI
jgi:tight adherence protein B